jgi:hypothetical protein
VTLESARPATSTLTTTRRNLNGAFRGVWQQLTPLPPLRFEPQPLDRDDGVRLAVFVGDASASFGDFLAALRASPESCTALVRALADVPFEAFAWECRPVSLADLDARMDMVAIASPSLAGAAPDASPFRAHLDVPDGSLDAVCFENLGGDAMLVVPRKRGPDLAYTHLAQFVRTAPAEQASAFWCEVARAAEARLQRGRPIWLSTAGLGVSWLHVRLDDRPKYYRYGPFRTVAN